MSADIHSYIHEHDPKHEGPQTFIQWKGTNVCMDFHCTCGLHMHFDCEFLYFVKCHQCGKLYGMGSTVKSIEIPPRLADQANEYCTWTQDGEDDTEAVRLSDIVPSIPVNTP